MRASDSNKRPTCTTHRHRYTTPHRASTRSASCKFREIDIQSSENCSSRRIFPRFRLVAKFTRALVLHSTMSWTVSLLLCSSSVRLMQPSRMGDENKLKNSLHVRINVFFWDSSPVARSRGHFSALPASHLIRHIDWTGSIDWHFQRRQLSFLHLLARPKR
jgi:hypothetical protein